MTDTRGVSIAFNKKHKNIIRGVRNVRLTHRGEHARLNFEPGSYADAQGQWSPTFNMHGSFLRGARHSADPQCAAALTLPAATRSLPPTLAPKS